MWLRQYYLETRCCVPKSLESTDLRTLLFRKLLAKIWPIQMSEMKPKVIQMKLSMIHHRLVGTTEILEWFHGIYISKKINCHPKNLVFHFFNWKKLMEKFLFFSQFFKTKKVDKLMPRNGAFFQRNALGCHAWCDRKKTVWFCCASIPGLTAMVNMTIMLWHGMIMVIHTRHGMIMAVSWHSYTEIYHDHGISVIENSIVMPW